MEEYDLAIIGGGPAALGAAIYAGRFRLRTVVLGDNFGGTMLLTDKIENYPGYTSITGEELSKKLLEHAKSYDVDMVERKVISISKEDSWHHVETKKGTIKAKALILATGSEWKKLKIPGEKEFEGNGVHYCALCDGYIYRDKIIGVIGGSDSAAKESLLLAQHAKKVYLIYRKPDIRAEPVTKERVSKESKIEMVAETNPVEIRGDDVVKSIVLDKPYKGKDILELDGLFISIGHRALSGLTEGLGIELNDKGEIITDRQSQTSAPGIFAAGDVTDCRFKQVISAVSEGVVAAYSAYNFLKGEIKT